MYIYIPNKFEVFRTEDSLADSYGPRVKPGGSEHHEIKCWIQWFLGLFISQGVLSTCLKPRDISRFWGKPSGLPNRTKTKKVCPSSFIPREYTLDIVRYWVKMRPKLHKSGVFLILSEKLIEKRVRISPGFNNVCCTDISPSTLPSYVRHNWTKWEWNSGKDD